VAEQHSNPIKKTQPKYARLGLVAKKKKNECGNENVPRIEMGSPLKTSQESEN